MTDLEGNVNLGAGNTHSYGGIGQQTQFTATPAPVGVPLSAEGAPLTAEKDSNAANQNTLNEPVTETIMRDIRMIVYKLKYVLNPKMREERAAKLRDWDLWGPLILCLLLAIMLSFRGRNNTSESVFGIIFVIIWVGSFIVTLNAKFLGGNISFFQSVCVLGYCVFPIDLAAFLLIFVGKIHIIINLVIVGLAFAWSTLSSVAFMGALLTEDKKVLGVYPVFLFYLFLAWFVLIA